MGHMHLRYLTDLVRPHLACALLVIGCGQAPASRPPMGRERPSMTVESEPRGADAERARAIREAEDFVRAQGYTDAPPSVSGDAVVQEGIEGTVADRRRMLEPRALRAHAS